MNFFKALGVSFICLSAFSAPLLAQEAASGESTTATTSTKNGIRFITKKPNGQIPAEIYMPSEKNKFQKIQVNKGLPGPRVMYTKGTKTLYLYSSIDEKGKPQGELIRKDFPADIGPRTLAIVDQLPNGKLDILFIDEDKIPYGAVSFYNLTAKQFVIKLTTPPSGEKDTIILPSLGTYTFGKNTQLNKSSSTTPAVLMDEKALPNGTKQWFKERGFMITTYRQRKVIMLLTPNSTGKMVELTEIMLFLESGAGAKMPK